MRTASWRRRPWGASSGPKSVVWALGFGFLVAVLLLAPASPVRAAALTWDGGGADANWTTANNWNPNGVPKAGDTVTFNDHATESEETVIINTDVVVAGMTFSSSFNGPVSITSGKSVLVRGNFSMASGTTINFDLADHFTVTGVVDIDAGTFTQSTGTAMLIAGANRSHTMGGATFYDLTIADATGPSTTGLVGYWKLDESSSINATDSSGNGTTLTKSGTTATSGSADVLFSNPYARTFAAGNGLDAGSLPNHLKPSVWTLSAWVWPSSVDTSGSDIINGGNNYALRIETDNTVHAMMRTTSGTYYTCSSQNLITINDAWHHIAATSDGTNLTVYLNGVPSTPCAHGSSQAWDQTANFSVGKHPTNTSFEFIGTADDVRVYSRVLTEAEIRQLAAGAGGTGSSTHSATGDFAVQGTFTRDSGTFSHSSGTATFASASDVAHTFTNATFGSVSFDGNPGGDGLVAHWNMDQSGATATDSSGNGNNLTHNNGATTSTTVPSTSFSNVRSASYTKDSSHSSTASSYSSNLKNANWAMSAWIRPTATDTGSGCDGGTGAEVIHADNDYGVRVCSTGKIYVFLRRASGNNWSNCLSSHTVGINDGNWYHIAAMNDNTAKKLYIFVNGQKTTNCSTYTGGQTNEGSTFYVGAHPGGAYDFNGLIDDLRMYNRNLTDAEVAVLAAGGEPSSGSVVFTPNTNLSVNGDLTIGSSSTLALGSNNLTVAGSLVNNGLITASSGSPGTFTLNATSSGKSLTSNGFRFPNLTINGSGGAWTLGDNMIVDGTLALTNGTLAASSYTIRANNITQSSGTFSSGTGTVVVNGASGGTLSVADAFNHLRIEDPTEANLVGYWKFDEGSGSTTRDESGNGLAGTLNNSPTWKTSALPSAITFDNPAGLTFDGTDDDVSFTAGTYSSFTVAAWVNATDGAGENNHPRILNMPSVSLSFRDADSNKLELNADFSTTQGKWESASLTMGSWVHVAVTYNGSSTANDPIFYINGVAQAVTETQAPAGTFSSTAGTAYIGDHISLERNFAGSMDDFRLYNTVLTADQIKALAAGRYPGTGSTATFTLGANTTTNGTFAIDSGTVVTSSYTLTAGNTDATKLAYVNAGGLTVGSAASTFKGGLSVADAGTLTMNTASGQVKVGSGKTFTLDGSLDASTASVTPTITSDSGTFTFTVGSSATATPVVNIDGLTVSNTGTNGMYINSVAGSTTTFTKFDNIAFSTTSGTYLLRIYAPTLSLYANGLSFDTTNTTYNVSLDGDGGNNTRMYIGGTCTESATRVVCELHDVDDDGSDVGDGDAVVQWTHGAYADTAGTVEGFITSAFDWDTFEYWNTYALFNNISGGTDRLYARNTDGAYKNGVGGAGYSWDLPDGDNFVGHPRWTQEGSTHYVYVVTAAGRVYKIQDTGTAFSTVGGWPYRHGASATATSPLAIDADNLYWAGNNGDGNRRLFSLDHGGPTLNGQRALTADVLAMPALGTVSTTSYVFAAASGLLYRMPVDLSAETTNGDPTSNFYGRVSVLGSDVFAIEDTGKLWAFNASNISTVNWSYQDTATHGSCSAGGNCQSKSIFYNFALQRVYFGDKDGHVYAVYNNSGTGTAVGGFPLRPGTSSDVFETPPLYRDGIIAIGAANGKVYFIDQNNGSNVPALIRAYNFGAAVSAISYDRNNSTSGEYMVGTADGRIYYIDRRDVDDPTPGSI